MVKKKKLRLPVFEQDGWWQEIKRFLFDNGPIESVDGLGRATCGVETSFCRCVCSAGAGDEDRRLRHHTRMWKQMLESCDQEQAGTFFGSGLPLMLRLVGRMAELFSNQRMPPLLLRKAGPSKAEMTRDQAHALVASMVLGCLYPQPMYFGGEEGQRTAWLWDAMFTQPDTFGRALIEFFNLAAGESAHPSSLHGKTTTEPGVVIERRRLNRKDQRLDFGQLSDVPVAQVRLCPGLMEDSEAPLHADFANEYIGGGVLRGAVAQEEILFFQRPAALTSVLLCSRMHDDECIVLHGCRRWIRFTGYGHALRFAGPGAAPPTSSSVPSVVAFDACPAAFRGVDQYSEQCCLRDTRKALVAFRSTPLHAPAGAVATGNWGGGAFRGNKELRFIEQLVAASVAGCTLHYYGFGERDIERPIRHFLKRCPRDATVADLWNALDHLRHQQQLSSRHSIVKLIVKHIVVKSKDA